MIWLVLRVVVFVGIIGAAAIGGAYLIDSRGQVAITWQGVEYPPLSNFEFLALIIIAMAALYLLYKLIGLALATLRFLLGDETALTRYWTRAKQRRGFEAVSRGMVSLAEGDVRAAEGHARKASRLLPDGDLTKLLNAQLAEAQGNSARAKKHYRLLAKEPQTAMLGVKGLLAQAVLHGETERALKFAEHAFAMRPGNSGIQQTLFDLQVKTGAWLGARRTIVAMLRAKTLPKDVATRRQAVIDLEIARAALAAGDGAGALKAATLALSEAPGLAPAAVFAARLHTADGAASRAARVLTEAWRHGPQPEIAHAFAEIGPDETPDARRKRFRALIGANPQHEESALLSAELAIADNDWRGARKAMGDLATTHPTHRSLAIMAAVEKGEGAAEAVVRGYLARAVTAPRGAHWICDRCGTAPGNWSAVCPSCGGFDTLAWRTPSDAPETLDAAMMPLMIDSETDKAEEDRLDAEAAEEALRESAEARA